MLKRISRPMQSLLTFDEVCLEHTFFLKTHKFKQQRLIIILKILECSKDMLVWEKERTLVMLTKFKGMIFA